LPPVIINVRVAADGIGDQLSTTVGTALALIGHKIHAMILDQDDAALMSYRFGKNRPQVDAFE
jgi:hypothetical protein